MCAIYRIPGSFGPSPSITTLEEVMSECPEVSRSCQISMVMEEVNKEQQEMQERVPVCFSNGKLSFLILGTKGGSIPNYNGKIC